FVPVVAPAEPPRVAASPADREQETRQWALFLHLSQYAGFVVPFAGLVAPIVLWQIKKAELPRIDAHGKVVVNWILSQIIYVLLCIPLIFLIIGIPLLIVVLILGLIYPIIGGLKASNGEVWKYPLSISFFPVSEAARRGAPEPLVAEPIRPRHVAEDTCMTC